MSVIKASALGLGSSNLLGKGEFAKVFKADLDGQAVAVKQASPTPHAKRAHRRELDALQQLSHPNIVQLLAATDDGRCLVLELCKGGTLEERLAAIRGKRSNSRGKSRRQPMPVRRIVQIALELMRGIGAMHEAGLCHGDVKSANILLAKTAVTAEAAGVKLADMGFARRIGEPVSEEDGGSVPFIPRELQLGLETVARASQDIYACGVAILDILCTGKPYEDLSVREFEEALEEGTLYARGTVPLAEFRNTEAADTLAGLVFEMVSHDPDARPTAAEAVARLEELAAALDGSKEEARTARRSASPASADSDRAESGTLSSTSGSAGSSRTLSGASGSADPLSPSFCGFQAALPSEDAVATMTATPRGSIEKCVSVDGAMSGTPAGEDHMHGYEPVPESDTESDVGPPAEAPALEMAVLAPSAFAESPVAQGSGHLLDCEMHSPPARPSMERQPSSPAAHATPARAIPQQPPWAWPRLNSSLSDALLASRFVSCCGLWGGRWAARRSCDANSDAPAGWQDSISDDMSARSAISEVLYFSPRLEDLGWKSEAPTAPVEQGEVEH